MGLDVYLERFEDFDDVMRRQHQYEAESKEAWSFGGRTYDNLTESEKDSASAACRAAAARLGLGEYGEPETDKISHNSERYPDHLFKVGYFRSAYNEGGINNVLRNLGLPDLYKVFDVANKHGYYVAPDWHASLEKAKALLRGYDAAILRDGGRLYATFIDAEMFATATSSADAIETFRRVISGERKSGFLSFSSLDGDFWLGEPLSIRAAIPGKQFRSHGVYLIGRWPSDEGDSYRQSIEIVIETIEWVLAQPRPDQFKLAWSS